MNEDFYYIEVAQPSRVPKGEKPAWISFGYGNKWTATQCYEAAEQRKKKTRANCCAYAIRPLPAGHGGTGKKSNDIHRN